MFNKYNTKLNIWAQAIMVYLSLNLFKYILSFKDPRYERVRNGDPFGATPTRVWYTYDEHKQTEDPYKNVLINYVPTD